MWNYYKDEIDDVDVNDSTFDGKSFGYKMKIIGKTPEKDLHNLEIQETQTDQRNRQYHL